jgi:hypothetical protein
MFLRYFIAMLADASAMAMLTPFRLLFISPELRHAAVCLPLLFSAILLILFSL